VKDIFWYELAAVPSEICDRVIQTHASGVKDASVYSRAIDGATQNLDKRRSKVNFHVAQEARDICDYFTLKANREDFGVYLGGYSDYQFTMYDGANHGCYGWHMDSMGGNAFTRKLSCIVILSAPDEYEGGELQIGFDSTPVKPEKGTVVVFPSPVLHQVLPVTAGVRFTLVSWAEGPQWR
jgi:PKHD-type hydroxylase